MLENRANDMETQKLFLNSARPKLIVAHCDIAKLLRPMFLKASVRGYFSQDWMHRIRETQLQQITRSSKHLLLAEKTISYVLFTMKQLPLKNKVRKIIGEFFYLRRNMTDVNIV